MKRRGILIVLLGVASLRVTAGDFCDGSRFFPLDKVLTRQGQFLDRRIKTHAILMTDAKEYTRILAAEGSPLTVLTTADDESTRYYKSNNHHYRAFSLVGDFTAKLRLREGVRYKLDMSKIRYYRQDVTLCGRLVKDKVGYRFAIDDVRVERSYLLHWKGDGLSK